MENKNKTPGYREHENERRESAEGTQKQAQAGKKSLKGEQEADEDRRKSAECGCKYF